MISLRLEKLQSCEAVLLAAYIEAVWHPERLQRPCPSTRHQKLLLKILCSLPAITAQVCGGPGLPPCGRVCAWTQLGELPACTWKSEYSNYEGFAHSFHTKSLFLIPVVWTKNRKSEKCFFFALSRSNVIMFPKPVQWLFICFKKQ